jgi:hypothetical protein
MEALEQTLFRFWSRCISNLRSSALLTGGQHSTEAYLRGFYDGLRDILGNPPGPELEFRHYSSFLDEDDQPDEMLLAHEHWIATSIFENELVAAWAPMEAAPVALDTYDPDCMWLDSQPNTIWGRIYKKPLRRDRPLERMALESTRRALQPYPAITPQAPPEQPPLLAETSYRAFTDEELQRLTGDWPALASAAHSQAREGHLRTAAENCTDPRVWTWHAWGLVNRRGHYLDEAAENRERWWALEKLKWLDPENGAAELLEAFLYLKVGLVARCVSQLARAFRRQKVTFYARDRWDQLWITSQMLGWTTKQSRQLVLGNSIDLLRPIVAFRKELIHTKARPNLRKLALQELRRPLLSQQMLGCSLLDALEPNSRIVRQFRKRSQENLDYVRRLLPEQLTEQRWARYFSDLINYSENEAIESLRDEGHVPQGKAESWLENILR